MSPFLTYLCTTYITRDKQARVANVKNQVENLENYHWQKYLTKAKYSKCLTYGFGVHRLYNAKFISTEDCIESSFIHFLLHTAADYFEAQTAELTWILVWWQLV